MIGGIILATLVGLAIAWAAYCWWMEFMVAAAGGGEQDGERQ